MAAGLSSGRPVRHEVHAAAFRTTARSMPSCRSPSPTGVSRPAAAHPIATTPRRSTTCSSPPCPARSGDTCARAAAAMSTSARWSHSTCVRSTTDRLGSIRPLLGRRVGRTNGTEPRRCSVAACEPVHDALDRVVHSGTERCAVAELLAFDADDAQPERQTAQRARQLDRIREAEQVRRGARE